MSRPVAALVAAAALVATGATMWGVYLDTTLVATSASHRPGRSYDPAGGGYHNRVVTNARSGKERTPYNTLPPAHV